MRKTVGQVTPPFAWCGSDYILAEQRARAASKRTRKPAKKSKGRNEAHTGR